MERDNESHFVYWCRLDEGLGPLNRTKDYLRVILNYCKIKSLTIFTNKSDLKYLESNSRVSVQVNIIEENQYFPQLFYILYQFNTLLKILRLSFISTKNIYYFRYTSFLFIPIFLKLMGKRSIFLEINGIPNQDLLESRKKPYARYLRKLLLFQYDKFLFHSVDYLLAVCEVFKKNLIKNYGVKKDIVVIPNGYFSEDVESLGIDKAKKKVGLDYKKRYCIYVGSLIYYEGVEFLVNAFQKFCSTQTYNDKVLLILGEGPLLKDLQSQITPEFKKNIVFLGYVPRQKMREYIAASDVGIYTPLEVTYGQDNQRGGSPLKIIDYLAAGRPILVPQSSYYQYMEDERIGRMFKSGESDSFCTVLTELMENDQALEKYGRNARRYAELNLHWKHTLSNLFAILEEAVSA